MKDIQALMRFANFYRNLIKDFFKITHLLNELLKRNVSESEKSIKKKRFKN